MDNEVKEMIDAIKSGQAYDYFANNYWKLEKEDLKNALLEYIYLAHENNLDENPVADELLERYN